MRFDVRLKPPGIVEQPIANATHERGRIEPDERQLNPVHSCGEPGLLGEPFDQQFQPVRGAVDDPPGALVITHDRPGFQRLAQGPACLANFEPGDDRKSEGHLCVENV
jgi:hypothetical protein